MGKLGYSSMTLTDLTETLPLSLVLESNQSQNIQIKNGTFYSPNFDVNNGGKELIITPSLFIGREEIKDIPNDISGDKGYIYYQIGDIDTDGTEKEYYFGSTESDAEVYVDAKGKLHIKKNFTKTITIEAYIQNFKHKDSGNTLTTISATNPITFLFLEEGSNLYSAIITSSDGREHFEESNKRNIILTAELYKGSEKIKDEEVSYLWDMVTDKDTENKTDDYNNNNWVDFISDKSSITVERSMVSNIEVFQCTITLKSGGQKFYAQKIIRDFTDPYTSQIIASSSTILTPDNPSVNLTHQIWQNTEIVNEENSTDFEYEWILLPANGEERTITGKTSKNLNVNINEEIFPEENFSIMGKATIKNKTVVISYIEIKYQPTTYSINISPKSIFVPATSDGSFKGNSFSQKIKFQLLDENKQPLLYEASSSEEPKLMTDDESTFSLTQNKDSNGKSLWDFDIIFNLDITNNNTLWKNNLNSKVYDFSYKYLNSVPLFQEEFEIIKNYAGANGAPGGQGFSGYTIDLSNEFHAFSGGESRADVDQDTSCVISGHYGNEKLDIEKITIGSTSGTTIYQKGSSIGEETYQVPNRKGYLFISAAAGSNMNEVNINIRTNKSTKSSEKDMFLTGIEPINFYITIKGKTSNLNFLKTFTYTINYNGKSYYLNLSENSIKYSESNGSYSPSSISVSALARETNGAAASYTNGKIIYSFDNKTWTALGSTGSISGYKNLENIYIRLYSGLATNIPTSGTVPSNTLIANEQYLLDTETIPVLTSLDGYQFGGENLIKWSKTMPLETNKWQKSSALNLVSDGDFSVMNFNITQDTDNNSETDAWYAFSTPKIPLTEDLRNKKLCLSFLFKCDNFNQFAPVTVDGKVTNPNYPLFICSCSENFSGSRDIYGSIGSIRDTIGRSTMSFETFENGKWCKVYKVFELSDSLFTSSENYTDKNGNGKYDKGEEDIPFSKCNYFWIQFYSKNLGTFQIKQPKLEIGNVPTSWSGSPSDIEAILENHYNTVFSSGNLTIDNDMKYYDLATTLQEKQVYCLSYSSYNTTLDSSSSVKQVTWELLYFYQGKECISSSGNFSGGQALKDFLIVPKRLEEHKNLDLNLNYTFRIYATTKNFNYDNSITTTFKNIKLEKGSYSTSFYKTTEELLGLGEDFFNASQNYADELNSAVNLKILDVEGNQINFASKDDFKDYVSKLGKLETTVGNNKMALESSITDLNSNFEEVKSHIKLGVITKEEASAQLVENTPYLALIVDSSSQVESNISMRLTNDRLTFFETKTKKELAYFSNNKLYVKSLEVQEDFRIGNSTDGFLQFSVLNTGIAFQWFE